MTDYSHEQYRSGEVYPLQNPIKTGWGVANQGKDPKENNANGRMTNQKGETIDFYITEIEATFAMTGTTAQSRQVRQFMPHNVVQPSINVKGIAPNQFQYQRLGSFVRSSQVNSLNLADQLRSVVINEQKVQVETVRLLIRNGTSPGVWNGQATKNPGEWGNMGRHVKGIHIPWLVEGYIKEIKTGGERENFSPEFEFEFFVAQSTFKQGTSNLGMWEDTRVYGSELKPWLDWIKKTPSSDFVSVESSAASQNTLDAKEKQKNQRQSEKDNLPAPGSVFDVPSLPELVEKEEKGEALGPPAPAKNIFEQ